MQNNKHIHQYNGYSVSPSAHRLPDGWFAANLLLTRGDARSAEPVSYKFDALDYKSAAHSCLAGRPGTDV
ncbi:hypothetical protein [Caballeronia arationis]|uniref:hypothetical protein n=1 Tax=Caballeronia arationis TaxID=1777142 RepID=UPI000B35D99B|nr:hypothetical protein [Caballeronia arationis]